MTITHAISDFDGFLTLEAESAAPAFVKWADKFCEETGVPRDNIDLVIEGITQEIRQDPNAGWNLSETTFVPATASAYFLQSTAFNWLLQRLGDINTDFNLPDNNFKFIQELFSYGQPYTKTVFNKDAKNFLDEIVAKYTFAVVSNSFTEKIRKDLLDYSGHEINVIGDAKKQDVESYADLLFNLIDEGFEPKNTAVMGDIYEMDLRIPHFIGFRTILLDPDGTKGRSTNIADNFYVAKDLIDVLHILKL